jgi:protein-disulfide isomerase
MKKDIYVIIGSIALIAALFLGAFLFYRQNTEPQVAPETIQQQPARADQSLLIREDSWSKGPLMARIAVVEFFDPECESCRAFHPVVERILSEYDGKIRYVVRYMTYHHNSAAAAKILEAAGEQGKYWEMLALLFEKQHEWGESREDKSKVLLNYASELGLDLKKVNAAVNSSLIAAKIERDKEDGAKLGVRQTPTFFVNGQIVYDFGEAPLRSAIQQAMND